MRVLHVLARMAPAGTEHQLVGMLEAAHGRFWDATLCLLHREDNQLTRRVGAAGVRVVRMAAVGRHPAFAAATFRRLMLRGGFDVVHSSLWGANAFTRLLVSARRRPAVVISERRVEEFRSARRRTLDLALRPVTDAYIGNSDAVVAFVQRAHRVRADRVHRVPNGVDRSVFAPAEQPRARAGRRLRIGAVGRLVHQKGFDVLIAALPKVLVEYDVDVEIAGQGELRAALERQAQGLPVRFVGLLDSPHAVARFLRSLDVFVMPSRYEGLPNAALEAAACGLDIVATDAPGMRAALGRLPLVPRDDPDALATAISAAIRDGAPEHGALISAFAGVADAHRKAFDMAVRRRLKI